jgi:pimeloyl-ACP methyl ester carboxylesterase
VTTTQTAPRTGYAPVNGLRMYYEIHGEVHGDVSGAGAPPLLLLHGGLFDIDLQFGELIPGLAEGRQVVATEFQGHGRTNDVDRPLSCAGLASDVVGLLQHLELGPIDVFGFSVGGGVALHLAIRHPELVRRAVISSASYHPDGDRPENKGAVGDMKVEMIAGTPMEEEYRAKSPNPDGLQGLLDKLGAFGDGFEGWSDDDIRGIAAPTLYTVGDCDAVTLEHAVRFVQLRGGDVNGDFVGVPASQLAVFPGTTHFFGLARPALVLEVVRGFLDAPEPAQD